MTREHLEHLARVVVMSGVLGDRAHSAHISSANGVKRCEPPGGETPGKWMFRPITPRHRIRSKVLPLTGCLTIAQHNYQGLCTLQACGQLLQRH
jgi:hypothetical protein